MDKKELHAAKMREWRKNNPERNRENARRYRKRNGAKYLERHARQMREYRERHPERAALSVKRSYAKNPEMVEAKERRFRYSERGKLNSRLRRQRRRALEKQAEGSFTTVEWLHVKRQQNNQCAHCRIVADLTIDHILPLNRGGSNYISNIQGLCLSCNSRKQDRLETELC